ncbi:hypothetical protein [Pseudomonas sp. BBP2017]|uniref:hypothetical protein n=1 Tax=Pseudomonas sp. BBP2017 TaxID=2109731 RepID=UPI000D117AB9|nr:hypothetical protein C6382_08585 [Pseudomonas sp. BBP2017]
MPRFDVDLCRVSREHYITGKAAINFPWPETTTGGWHHLSYWDREAGQLKVSLAGIHYPDTSAYFGEFGILGASQELRRRGWTTNQGIYIADHFRAAADMIFAWALGSSMYCSVELADWFPEEADFQGVIDLLTSTLPKLELLPRERFSRWLEAQQQKPR